jgi:hypothetical protein
MGTLPSVFFFLFVVIPLHSCLRRLFLWGIQTWCK